MRKKVSLLTILVLVVFLVAGCAAWKTAVSQVTPEQQTQIQGVLTPIAAAAPVPYNIPATAAVGAVAFFIAALGNLAGNAVSGLFKKKTTTGT